MYLHHNAYPDTRTCLILTIVQAFDFIPQANCHRKVTPLSLETFYPRQNTLDNMLKPLDNLDILAIVDNEVDPMSPAPPVVSVTGRLGDVALTKGKPVGDELGGGNVKELSMEQICCGAHGLSLMIVSGFEHQLSQQQLIVMYLSYARYSSNPFSFLAIFPNTY